MCWFLMSQKVALTFFYRLMQQFYSLMRKETTTICFGSMFTLISSVCEHRTESDRVGGISQPSSISQKQVQLWWKNLLCLWLSCFCVSMKSTGYRAQCSYIPFFLKKKKGSSFHGFVNCFSSQQKREESLGMFLVESKKKWIIYNGFVYVALEPQSNDSDGENIQTWKTSWFYSISDYFPTSS